MSTTKTTINPPQTHIVGESVPPARKPTAAKIERTFIKDWLLERPSEKLSEKIRLAFGDPEGTTYHRSEQPTFIFFRRDPHVTINHAADSILSGMPRFEWKDSGMPGLMFGYEIDYNTTRKEINPDLTD